MIFLILLGILFFVQLFAASWYDLAKKATDSKKAFKHKMICSAVFVASGLLCTAISNSFATYSLLFLVALALLFLHDIIEEKQSGASERFAYTFGFIAYLIISFALSLKDSELFGNRLSNKIHFIILLTIAIICALVLIKKPAASLFISSAYMLVNAILFGINLQNSGDARMQAASCAVIMGSLALAVSNALCALDKSGKKSLLRINLYYFGLMFTSCSIAVL